MPSKKQLRITIPKWVAELKGWNKDSKLQIIPIIKDDKKSLDKKTIFIIKEVNNKKNE